MRDVAQKASYQALLQEFVKLMAEGNVKYISAFTTAKKITDLWQGILELSDAKLSVLKLSDQWKFKTDAEKVGIAQNWASAQKSDAEWADVFNNHDKGWKARASPIIKAPRGIASDSRFQRTSTVTSMSFCILVRLIPNRKSTSMAPKYSITP